MSPPPTGCPCGSGAPYRECCGPFIAGERPAPTAEALMRSRYVAYALRDAAYLRRTYAPEVRPPLAELEEATANREWLGLEILGRKRGRSTDKKGEVEFVARWRRTDSFDEGELHETSRFRRERGQWLYIDGTYPCANPHCGHDHH